MRPDVPAVASPSQVEDMLSGDDPIWWALADSLVTLTMSKLLNLVPRLSKAMDGRMRHIDRVLLGRPWLCSANIKQNW